MEKRRKLEMKGKPIKPEVLFTNVFRVLFLGFYSIVMLYPFIWMLLTSVRKSYEIFAEPWALPSSFEYTNFLRALRSGIADYFLNSVFISGVTVFFILLFSSLAAFTFAKHFFRGKSVLFITLVAGYFIPVQVTLIPLYNTLRALTLLDSYPGIILPYISYGIPFSVLLLTTYFRATPKELEDAARIDGCTELGIYARIVLPISKPGIATILIFQFINAWNEFIFALTFLRSKQYMTLPIGLMNFRGEHVTDWSAIMAGVSIATIPLVIVYVIFQKSFIRGLTAGAVKA
jgi:raffinose/stachyose/melibiose transport system permease protein